MPTNTQELTPAGQPPVLALAHGSPLRLFRVQLERTLYVLAKDAREAERIGERNEREECGNDLDSCHATPATDLAKVPVEWRDSLPYAPCGHKEGKTVEQLLANNEGQPTRKD